MVHGVLKAALNGGERREDDFYPTPAPCVWALLPQIAHFPRKVWEPSCGGGSIAVELEAAGFEVVATDLRQRTYGQGSVDFFGTRERLADAVVTNPPFGGLLSHFIGHVFDLEVPYIALLLNVNAWHSARRTKLWQRRVPEAVYALCWKPDFTGAGKPYFNVIWTVWGPKSAPFTRYERLLKPAEHPALAELVG